MYQEGEASPAALEPLKPKVLDIEINSPKSEEEWKHWKKAFRTT